MKCKMVIRRRWFLILNNTIMVGKFNRIYLFLLVVFYSFSILAQTDGGVKIMPAQGDLYENAKKVNNPYLLPLGGKKLGGKGFLFPYPLGIMLNGYAGSQNVTISDLTVGIDDASGNVVIPDISLDKVVDFREVTASVKNFNMRFDVWALPFLDVYGIFGKAWVETKVDIGSIAGQSVNIDTQADFNGYVYGYGVMLTGGIRSIFFSLDFNQVWTHFDEMKKDNSALNLSPRIGYIFHFDHQPEENFSLWTGLGRIFLNNKTVGSINLSDVAPDMGENYENQTWYQNLTPVQQELTNRVVDNFVDKNKGDIINYSLNKRPEKNWCMIFGAQYQLNRHWQFRVETNFLGGRESGLISANYRFGLIK